MGVYKRDLLFEHFIRVVKHVLGPFFDNRYCEYFTLPKVIDQKLEELKNILYVVS
jgi:hypothetical protein